MGGKAKPIPQSNEEKALLRAQLQTLERQDTEINDRKRRILRGQYSSFGGLLKSGLRSGSATGTDVGLGGGRTGLGRQPSRSRTA